MSGATTRPLLFAIIFLAGGSLAFGQAGSTGGTLGKTGKSLSGEESPAEPSARTKSRAKARPPTNRDAFDQPAVASVAGRWRWVQDCTVARWQGEFDLTETSRGHFNGRFAETAFQDTGSITNGTHGGGNISFTRTNSVATQYWRGRFAGGRMKGTSSGNANCTWEATRK